MRIRANFISARSAPVPFAVLWLLCLLVVFARTAVASPVVIQDASFDNRSLGVGGTTAILTPWHEAGGLGNSGGYVERVGGFTADGQNHLRMESGHNVWQDLGVTYQANTRYTLTVAVGNRSGQTLTGNQSRYILTTGDGTVFATRSINAWIQHQGTFADAPSLVFETASDSAAIGKPIRILLQAGGSGRSYFDKIRLTAIPPPLAITLAPTGVTYTSAVLNGMVNARGSASTVLFEHGPTASFGNNLRAAPFSITGNSNTAVSVTLDGLTPGTTYHYRVTATNEFGTIEGTDFIFTTKTPPYLSRLAVSAGTLTPAFSPTVSNYTLQVPATANAIGLSLETEDANAIILVGGVETASGTTSQVPLVIGNSVIIVEIKEPGSSLVYSHVINVVRPPESFVFTSADKPAFSAHSFDPTGLSAELSLGFAPSPGTTLTVVDTPGLAWLKGRFENLAHGEVVELVYNGIRYAMVADYYGGDGNDLVLKWAHTALFGWGFSSTGQVGDGTTTFRSMPVPVDTSGGLAGKVVMDVISGQRKTFALCADGSIFEWVADKPVEFQKTGALLGKRVVSLAVGSQHQLALCDDGTLAIWGSNFGGAFGPALPSWSGGSPTPVQMPMVGALEGKTVVAIACDAGNLVLCDDGSLVRWGSMPVLVDQSGVLYGKKVIAIAEGPGSALALTEDGIVAALGGISGNVPVLVDHEAFGGRPVVAISCGIEHSLALCSDGKVFAWGVNREWQFGNGTRANSLSPTPVSAGPGDVLGNRKVIGISARGYGSLAICEDGVAADWGSLGAYGQEVQRPRLLEIAGLGPDTPVTGGVRSLGSGVLMVALQPAPAVFTGEAHSITDQGAVLAGRVDPNGGTVRCYFELGPNGNYGTVIEMNPATVDGVAEFELAALAEHLKNGSTYHYRLVAEIPGGRIYGENKTFTTTSLAGLALLAPDQGSLGPAFDGSDLSYDLVVPNDVESLRFQMLAATESAEVRVNGIAAGTGGGVATVPVAPGSQTVSIHVDAGDGINSLTYQVRVIRLPGVFVLDDPAWDPIIVSGFTAFGEIDFELGFAPAAGTDFTLVRSTGLAPIEGGFSNLPQGTLIHLEHGGVRYPFVVNYFGGNGNELVLQWAQTRLAAWGENLSGQLGVGESGVANSRNKPVAVDASGILQGKTVIKVATGGGSTANSNAGFVVAICNDGTIATWGNNNERQLGDGSTTTRLVPGGMLQNGVLAGKTPVAVAAGQGHVLVLCSDGSLVSWGHNTHGQLGTGDTNQRLEPVVINASGPLAGRRIVAVAAAHRSSYTLCDDGVIFSWGDNMFGQLGNGTNTNLSLPTKVDHTGILNGQRVVAIDAGLFHAHALCANGRFASWGAGQSGRLGNGSTTDVNVPRWADHSGVLAGRSVVRLKGGGGHGLALCADGVIASWGLGDAGQLGFPTGGGNMMSPGLVDMTGVLAGKTITSLSAGTVFSLALASDGTLASWGNNNGGKLGIGTNSFAHVLPVEVDRGILRPGERFTEIFTSGSSSFSLALIAGPPVPEPVTLAAAGIIDSAATLNARIYPNGEEDVAIFFELWEPGAEEPVRVLPADPQLASGTGHVDVEARVSGLTPNTVYRFRAITESLRGRSSGAELAFTTTGDAVLSALTLSAGQTAEVFSGKRFGYTLMVPQDLESTTVTPVAASSSSTIRVNGEVVPSGGESAPLPLDTGANEILVSVTAEDATNVLTYAIVIIRLPERFVLKDHGIASVSAGSVSLNGSEAIFSLAFAPVSGRGFTLIENTGFEPITGTFGNMPQGGIVELEYDGIFYRFIADYHGGDGNDLVLKWASTRLYAWGLNAQGQLGIGNQVSSNIPALVGPAGAMAGKGILRYASRDARNLVLCADGSLYEWGSMTLPLPVPVDQTGALNGKRVTQISVGASHSLVLCSDGSLFTWGRNTERQLGNPALSVLGNFAPVPVDQSGVLAGKRVIAIAAGANHNVVLCTDGTLAVWGANGIRQLADGTTSNRSSPILVKRGGVLAGKHPAAIMAGFGHSLVLCSDGTLAAWGFNNRGQLGISINPLPPEPVLVDRSGILFDKEIAKLAAGYSHNLALCADGTLAAWGYNINGALGDGTTTTRVSPGAVAHADLFESFGLASMAGGLRHSIIVTSDGRAFAWGGNLDGQLGVGSNADSTSPLEVDRSMLVPGERFTGVSAGDLHNLALAALPSPTATALAASDITGTSVNLRGLVQSSGNTLGLAFEYGIDGAFESVVDATPESVLGLAETEVSALLTGLKPGTTYHFRVVAENFASVARSQSMTFTTLSDNARLAGITNRLSNRRPAFHPETFGYIASVDFATSDLEIRPLAEHPAATVTVNGIPVLRGSYSPRLPLAVGDNNLVVVITAEDGITTLSYTTRVTRLPEFFDLSPDSASITVDGFSASWRHAPLRLNFHPAAGMSLTVVENRSLEPIHGRFTNLAQGQRVTLSFERATYDFVANYHGGSGNDLVLQWANTAALAWGLNSHGQLGDGTATAGGSSVTVALPEGGFAGKTLFSLSAGYLHSLALFHDGTVASWGYNVQGQLGLGHTEHSHLPQQALAAGALAGRTVVAIAAGAFHNLALFDDGTLVSWGMNNHGQLGTGDRDARHSPTLVEPLGALAGKHVIAIAAGSYHSLALCDDGTVAAWGYNDEGELGDGTTATALLPVAVDVSGALAGKSIARISTGQYHTLALCIDGTLVAWGWNGRGQLGDGTTTDRHAPIALALAGEFAGKPITALSAGGMHSLLRFEDGSFAGWGDNSRGQLITGGAPSYETAEPLEVNALELNAGAYHSVVRRTSQSIDVRGDPRAASSPVVTATGDGIAEGARFVTAATGAAAFHSLAIIALPNHLIGLADWRVNHFGSAANEGEAADCHDCLHDGVPNLVKYAFALDPWQTGVGKIPQPQLVGDRLELRFTPPAGVPDIEYDAEWSPDLSRDSWQAVPDSGNGDEHLFSLPLDTAPSLFMRLRVRVR